MDSSVSNDIKDQVLALIGSGNIDEAIAILSEACSNDSDNAQIHALLGVAYQHKSDRMHAVYHFEEALRLDESAKNYYNLGAMYEFSHRIDEAIRQYNMALEMDPDYKRAKNALDRLHQTYLERIETV
jgi:tetratricopeptide (TPR) repeat protein